MIVEACDKKLFDITCLWIIPIGLSFTGEMCNQEKPALPIKQVAFYRRYDFFIALTTAQRKINAP